MQRWKSLWTGPGISDCVDHGCGDGSLYYRVWFSSQLYALDMEDRAWTLCQRGDYGKGWKWIQVDDLVSGAAGRQTLGEEAA